MERGTALCNSPLPTSPRWGEGHARPGLRGGVEGKILHKKPNPALVLPEGRMNCYRSRENHAVALDHALDIAVVA